MSAKPRYRFQYDPPAFNGPFYIAPPKKRPHLYPYVCFACRTTFRRPVPPVQFARPCPSCGATAAPLWSKFKPPRKGDRAEWDKVEAWVREGFFFLPVSIQIDLRKHPPAGDNENHQTIDSYRKRWPDYYLALSASLNGDTYKP